MFNLAIWFLQRWLRKKEVDGEAVIIISGKRWSFDDFKKHENYLEE